MSLKQIKSGDLVISTAGKDKDRVFLVVDVFENRAKNVDGKSRKVTCPKLKNIKHLKEIDVDGLSQTATDIKNGNPVGNKRLKREIAKKFKRED